LGKQMILNEKDLHEMVLPSANDVRCVVLKTQGFVIWSNLSTEREAY